MLVLAIIILFLDRIFRISYSLTLRKRDTFLKMPQSTGSLLRSLYKYSELVKM